MFSFLFYDPNRQHYPSTVDRDILFLQSSHRLYDSISTDNHIQQIVCICCPDTSTIIRGVQTRRENVLIYWCKEHGTHVTDPALDHNVRDDIVFNSDSGWELKGRLALMEACRINQNKAQALDEAQQIEIIEQQSFAASQASVNVVDQQGNTPLNTSSEANESEETT